MLNKFDIISVKIHKSPNDLTNLAAFRLISCFKFTGLAPALTAQGLADDYFSGVRWISPLSVVSIAHT